MSSSIRVAIVEDDPLLRDLLSKRIMRGEGMRVVRSFDNGEDFLTALPDLDLHVVLMDINLPGANGIETVRKAKVIKPEEQFMMITIFENPAYIFEALRAGASGYLLKSTSEEEMLNAVREVHDGGSPMNSTIARMVVSSFQEQAQQRINDELLTDREKEMLDGLAAGLQYKEIAAKAGISPETVRVHVRHVYRKLQVNSRAEAVRKVYPRG